MKKTSLLKKIFEPSSVAVIGASSAENKWGYVVTKRLIDAGFEGNIYPVNPKGGEILGLKAYPGIKDIPGPVDLAVIGIRSNLVIHAVKACIEKDVKGLIVVTSGFGETGEEGKKAEKEILELIKQSGTRIIGPNCMGVFNASGRLNAGIIPDMKPGPIAVIAQSGNIGIMLFERAVSRGLQLSAYVGVGNQSDLEFHEIIPYYAGDQDTRVIFCYIEGLKSGRAFLETATEVITQKPLLVVKSGRSQTGRRAVSSHTGTLAGSEAVYDAAFRQAGVIRLTRGDEIFPVAEALIKCPLPKGNNVGIVTDGGGFAVMSSDAAERYGLNVAGMSVKTINRLRGLLPPHANAQYNPVDTAGGMDDNPYLFAECTEVLLEDENIDAVVFVGMFGGYKKLFYGGLEDNEIKTARRVTELAQQYQKPVLIQTPYTEPDNHCSKIFYEANIPVYDSLEHVMQAMAALAQYGQYRRMGGRFQAEANLPSGRSVSEKIILKALVERKYSLPENEGRDILRAYGIEVPPYAVARTAEEAVKAAQKVGLPVALKILTPDIVHKSDVGGVALNLGNEKEVEEAFAKMMQKIKLSEPDSRLEGVLLTPFQSGGTEVIIGLNDDPQFGPVVMFGLGGVFVEVLEDVAFRVAPFNKAEALRMIEDVKGYGILTGVRGQKPRDLDALAGLLIRVGKIGLENPEIESIDLNPVLAMEKGTTLLDARVILRK